jgi:hypothetical protein
VELATQKEASLESWAASVPIPKFVAFCELLNQGHTSGVDLTFATHRATSSSSECQIHNSTRNLYLLVVL